MSAGLPLQGERELCSQKWQKNVRMLINTSLKIGKLDQNLIVKLDIAHIFSH